MESLFLSTLLSGSSVVGYPMTAVISVPQLFMFVLSIPELRTQKKSSSLQSVCIMSYDSPQAHNHHPLTHQLTRVLSQPSPSTAGNCVGQPHRDRTEVSAFSTRHQQWFVVCSQSSLCSAPLTWHTGFPFCSCLLGVVTKGCQSLWPCTLPFAACRELALLYTPHRLHPDSLWKEENWGTKVCESWYRLHSERALLCHRHLLVHSLLMIALLGLTTFTGHRAVIPNSW